MILVSINYVIATKKQIDGITSNLSKFLLDIETLNFFFKFSVSEMEKICTWKGEGSALFF